MNYKTTPNHRQYLLTLSKIGAEQRLIKALELSSITKELFINGLVKGFQIRQKQKLKKYT